MSDQTSPIGRSKLKEMGFVLLGLIALPFLILLAPRDILRAIRTVFRGIMSEFKNGPSISLADAPHIDRITFTREVPSPAADYRQDSTDLVKELVEDADWVSLAELMVEWDQKRAKCPAGYPMVNLATNVFLNVVSGEPDLDDCAPVAASRVPEQMVEKIEILAAGKPDLYPLAALAAQLRMTQAWDLRGGGYVDSVPDSAWAQIDAHFKKAEWLLKTNDAEQLNSPLLATIAFRLCDHMDPADVPARLRKSYARWCALDPDDMTAHEEYAFKMLPRWHGTYEDLEVGLRRATLKGGAKSYAAGYLGVVNRDDGALATLEAQLFIEGLDDLIKYRGRDILHVTRMIQTVLEMASDCRYMADDRHLPSTIREDLLASASTLDEGARSIAQKHLRGLNADAWDGGYTEALDQLSEMFQPELRAGATFTLDDNGLTVIAPQPEPDPLSEPAV